MTGLNIKVVAFDCDGVLFDTRMANKAFYNKILSHLNKPSITPEQFEHAHMHTADAALANLFPDKQELAAAQTFRKSIKYDEFIRFMNLEPDFLPLIESISHRYKIALATNRSDSMARVLTDFQIKDAFDLVVTALDVKNPKPDPEPLIKVLDHFGVDPSEAVYVGDSHLDEIAAKAARIPLIAYENTSLNAQFHINRLKEIEKILEDLG